MPRSSADSATSPSLDNPATAPFADSTSSPTMNVNSNTEMNTERKRKRSSSSSPVHEAKKFKSAGNTPTTVSSPVQTAQAGENTKRKRSRSVSPIREIKKSKISETAHSATSSSMQSTQVLETPALEMGSATSGDGVASVSDIRMTNTDSLKHIAQHPEQPGAEPSEPLVPAKTCAIPADVATSSSKAFAKPATQPPETLAFSTTFATSKSPMQTSNSATQPSPKAVDQPPEPFTPPKASATPSKDTTPSTDDISTASSKPGTHASGPATLAKTTLTPSNDTASNSKCASPLPSSAVQEETSKVDAIVAPLPTDWSFIKCRKARVQKATNATAWNVVALLSDVAPTTSSSINFTAPVTATPAAANDTESKLPDTTPLVEVHENSKVAAVVATTSSDVESLDSMGHLTTPEPNESDSKTPAIVSNTPERDDSKPLATTSTPSNGSTSKPRTVYHTTGTQTFQVRDNDATHKRIYGQEKRLHEIQRFTSADDPTKLQYGPGFLAPAHNAAVETEDRGFQIMDYEYREVFLRNAKMKAEMNAEKLKKVFEEHGWNIHAETKEKLIVHSSRIPPNVSIEFEDDGTTLKGTPTAPNLFYASLHPELDVARTSMPSPPATPEKIAAYVPPEDRNDPVAFAELGNANDTHVDQFAVKSTFVDTAPRPPPASAKKKRKADSELAGSTKRVRPDVKVATSDMIVVPPKGGPVFTPENPRYGAPKTTTTPAPIPEPPELSIKGAAQMGPASAERRKLQPRRAGPYVPPAKRTDGGRGGGGRWDRGARRWWR
jgi:hypothetical protein